jgi:hypothetical protein
MKVGLISDINFTKHMQFQNYYYALLDIYGEIRLVDCICDLDGLNVLFIGGAFHGPHMDVYQSEGFIEECNKLNITVVLISVEKIMSNNHPTHIDLYNQIAKANKFVHYTYDVDDCKTFGTKLFRVLMSKHFKDEIIVDTDNKANEIVFIGLQYQWRRPVIDYVRNHFGLTIYNSCFPTWKEYMRILSRYRFVLSPLGNANAFVAKFYEILLVKSIPIQQVKIDTLQYYDKEAGFSDCIYFEDLEELPEKIKLFTQTYSQSELWLEDDLKRLLTEDNLL